MRENLSKDALSAFTLVEMLVVMAIIGMLAAMVLPALSRAREHGRLAVCCNNLRQIGLCLAQYERNNDDYLPSYPGYGLYSCLYTLPNGGGSLTNFSGAGPWQSLNVQGVSRHMVVAYGDAIPDGTLQTALAPGNLNFVPVGLGLLITTNVLQEPKVLDCPSMKGLISTYYWASQYIYDPSVWQKLGGTPGRNQLLFGDARNLYHVQATAVPLTWVTAILSSYSYRDTPFYCRTTPDNAASKPGRGWRGYTSDSDLAVLSGPGAPWIAQWALPAVKPVLEAQFMTPPFKTHRTLGNRAIVADSFDYASPSIAPGTFQPGGGLVLTHHGNGYNVLYGDGHVAWYDDTSKTIRAWKESDWNDPANLGSDNFTISSPSSQLAWNIFDNTVGIDRQ